MSKKQELPSILERIQRCRYCGREVTKSALSFSENPFCDVCLDERVGLTRAIPGEIRWRPTGHYMELIRTAPRRPS
jgi:hypothetical protein